MFLQFALVAILALSGLTGPAPRAQDSSAPKDRVVAQTVAGGSASTVTPGVTGAPGTPSDGVSVKKLDIVVPPVEPSGKVATPDRPLETQGAAGVVVADQLVAPKRVESKVVEAAGFQTLGVTWPKEAAVGDLGGQVRTRTDGKWSKWVDLQAGDNGPDAGTADARHAVHGTDPVSIGHADAVQLAFAATAKGGPAGLSLALVGSAQKPVSTGVVGSSAVGAATIQTAAYSTAVVQAVAAPTVITRAQWGAPAQACTPDVASTLVGAAVHHTATTNDYWTVADAMQQISNIAAYHINVRGWCDIGYNFIVDKWGNIYEGRAGSLTQPVVGAHAGGFNTGTVGVSMLGTYDAAPPPATQQGVAQIIGWRLGAYGIDPQGSMSYYTSDGGAGVRYRNQNVALPRVFGHRDVWFTECPGNGGYSALPNIRPMAATSGYAARFTQARSVVKALYQDLLLRGVDPVGLQTWSAMLAGGASQTALVASLTSSDEYIQLRIRQAYREVLGRVPDAGGMAAWSQAIRAGSLPVDGVQRIFYDSQEYYQLSGGTRGGYIDLLYRTAFNRPASVSESLYWSNLIAVVGRSKVVDGIWFSMEAALYRAGNYYTVFLKRDPDRAGQEGWALVLLVQGEGAVRIGIAGSEEYRLLSLQRYP